MGAFGRASVGVRVLWVCGSVGVLDQDDWDWTRAVSTRSVFSCPAADDAVRWGLCQLCTVGGPVTQIPSRPTAVQAYKQCPVSRKPRLSTGLNPGAVGICQFRKVYKKNALLLQHPKAFPGLIVRPKTGPSFRASQKTAATQKGS